MIRSVLERMVRGVAFRKRLPTEFASRSIYVTPDSALSYLKPSWNSADLQLLTVASRFVKSGFTVWDIGANVGVFAFAAAHRAGGNGTVIAVEPDPFLATLLQRSVLHHDNADLRVSILCAAVSNTSGLARLFIASRGRSSNSLQDTGHRSQAGGIRAALPVATTTLDALQSYCRCPDFIKIDVEGAETLVLEGATHVLRECRPVIYIEVGDQQRQRVTEILRDHRYRLLAGDSLDEHELAMCEWNTLAVPLESAVTPRRHRDAM